jgi:outer membrane protein assembly factor BamB
MGDVIWDIVGVDINAGEFYTAAPVIWEDPSIWGTRATTTVAWGLIRAFDARTGKRLWTFDTIPQPATPPTPGRMIRSGSRRAVVITRPKRWTLRPGCFIRRSGTQGLIS